MTLEKIQRKVRELHAKTRRQVIGNIIVPIIAVTFYAFGIRQFEQPLLRTLFAFGIAWSLAGFFYLNRGMWSATLPEEAAMSTGLESYRREVERRRFLFGRFMLWGFGPAIFAVATLIALLLNLGIGSGILLRSTISRMIPFLTMLVLWLAGIAVLRMREQRRLQREVEELNEIERMNR